MKDFNQVLRAESFKDVFFHLFPQVRNALKGDLGPLVFLPEHDVQNII